MVKNELGIRSQQTYNVASKLAANSISKINYETANNITNVKKRIPFKEALVEEKLFNANLEILNDNIEALFINSSYQLIEKELKNKIKYKKFEWSLYKIDRSNPNKEEIKKIISIERQRSVGRENAYKIAQFQTKWHEKEFEERIAYRCKYDNMMEEIYGDNARLQEGNYNVFFNETKDNHLKLVNETKEKLNNFYPVILNAINNAYTKALANKERETIFELSDRIIEYYKEYETISIDLVNQNVDLQVLNEQTKEKLDVYQEKQDLLALIEKTKKAKDELLHNISKTKNELEEAYNSYKEAKSSPANVIDVSCDNLQMEIINTIKESFLSNDFEKAFDLTFIAIKKYVNSLCPFFEDYLNEAEKEFDNKVIEYRKKVIKTLPKDLQKLYSNEENYIKYLCNYNKNIDISEITLKHKERIEEIKQEKNEKYKKLSDARKVRISEYKEQKAAAKISLKNASAVKSNEIKEVVKLYKKAINAGELKNRYSVLKSYLRQVKEEKTRYKEEVLNEGLPEVLSLKNEYKANASSLKKRKGKELSLLTKELKKEYKSSKYKKNSSTAKRENGLGYLFLSIWAIGFIALTLIPTIYIFLISFNKVGYSVNGFSKLISFSGGITFPSFVGLDNFESLFLSNVDFTYSYLPQFFRSLLFYVPIVVFIGFILAMLLNTKIHGRTLFRVIYFLPVVIVSGPILVMLNESNTSNQSSIRLTLDGSSIATILASLSPKALQYANEVFQNFIIILWMTGVPIVLFISALQKINHQLYEAAEIDGANKWQMLWTITFPLIKSVLLIVCLFTIMQVTTINVGFVNPINGWIENQLADGKVNYGLVAVAAWAQTLVVLLFVGVSFLLFREREFISKDKNYEEMEEIKRKKQQRKAKLIAFFHVNEIKAIIAKVTAPITKFIHNIKAKRKEKEEGGY